MPLQPGSWIGPYQIVSLSAREEWRDYRARDAQLSRDVAIKVLPALFTTDGDRLARFRREAQLLASLNHQNIAHILRSGGSSVSEPHVDRHHPDARAYNSWLRPRASTIDAETATSAAATMCFIFSRPSPSRCREGRT